MSEKLPESPEAIAYKLMQDVLKIEGKTIDWITKDLDDRYKFATREDILNTYSECAKVVKLATRPQKN